MYLLIRSENGRLNDLKVMQYYTIWAAQQAMSADFMREYEDFYDTTEPPKDEDNGSAYLYEGDRAMLSLDTPDTPEWAIVELDG